MKSKRKLSVSQLRIIDAVAQTGRISLAAKQLGVSQPAISGGLLTIERMFDVHLFEKDGHEFHPTRKLQSFLPEVRTALRAIEDIEDQLDVTNILKKERLNIAYSTEEFAIPQIAKFIQAHSEVNVNARCTGSLEIFKLLNSGEVQLGFVTARSLPDEFEGIPLFETSIVLTVPLDHPLAERGNIDWSELGELNLVQSFESSGSRQLFEGAATLARARVNTVPTAATWNSIARAVLAGCGVCVCLERDLIGATQLAKVTIGEEPIKVRH